MRHDPIHCNMIEFSDLGFRKKFEINAKALKIRFEYLKGGRLSFDNKNYKRALELCESMKSGKVLA